MKNNVRKGQAALEFMMTYGWAILVVLAAIGALSYFGVLNPSRFTPDTCLSSSGFSCPGKPIVNDTAIVFSLVNGLGYNLVLNGTAGAGATTSPALVGYGCTAANIRVCPLGSTSCTSTAYLVNDSLGATVVLSCTSLATANVVKGDIKLTYMNPQTGLFEPVIVTITGKSKS